MEINQALARLWAVLENERQVDIAPLIGVSPSTITRWRQGEKLTPSMRKRLIEWAQTISNESAPELAVRESRPVYGAEPLGWWAGRWHQTTINLRVVLEQQESLVLEMRAASLPAPSLTPEQLSAAADAEELVRMADEVLDAPPAAARASPRHRARTG